MKIIISLSIGPWSLKKLLNVSSRPSEHPPVRGGEMSKCLLGGIIGCKDKTWFANGSNIAMYLNRQPPLLLALP